VSSFPAALVEGGVAAAGRELDGLVALFGRDSVVVELTHHGYPQDDDRNDALAALAARYGLRRWRPGTCITPDPADTGWPR
jgi:DNA polymerase III alpha subunit